MRREKKKCRHDGNVIVIDDHPITATEKCYTLKPYSAHLKKALTTSALSLYGGATANINLGGHGRTHSI